MSRISLLFSLIILATTLSLNAQTEWVSINDDAYSIKYPENWELDKSDLMGTNFILFSPKTSAKDPFRENVNFLVQDLTGHDIDLDKFISISEEQIKSMVEDYEILVNERITRNGKAYHKIVYTGKYTAFNLRFEQLVTLQDNNAYILTFTSEQVQYDSFKDVSETIINSFVLK